MNLGRIKLILFWAGLVAFVASMILVFIFSFTTWNVSIEANDWDGTGIFKRLKGSDSASIHFIHILIWSTHVFF